uniref:NADH-ubiquinone oxidoreductase chain 2 n=1 Tax=Elodes minuta TaxID=877997 RepID=A0A7D7F9F6_9COLE|nr:NADH dehydrogenase subunit 2 [Elodes minuta]QMP96567.1 NADH dehydrogenase subunit 2 [Elodes minuta]
MNNIYKMIFFITAIVGTLISISSYSWIGTWMGLEINLISFIPLINDKKNPLSAESSMKYFLVQALASSALLFSVMILMMNNFNQKIAPMILLILNSALLMKMGAAPFHFWVPQIMIQMNWNKNMILLTSQKIAPMILLMYTNNSVNFMMMMIIMSMTVGSIMGLNQTNLKTIMAYSSINHTGWMISAMLLMENIWMTYFIIYCMISLSMMKILKIMNINHLKQLYFSSNKSMLIKFSFIINFLSMGGLPPFLGFLPKLLIIQNLIFIGFKLMAFMMIMLTMITLFFYLRVTFSILMMNFNNFSWKINVKFFNNKIIFVINSMSLTGLIFLTNIINF